MNESHVNLIVILGASYAGGWHPGRLPEGAIVNKGVGGEQSHEMLARFEQDVVALHPRAVLLWGFINDIFRSDREAVEPAKDRAKESFEAMVALARQHGIEPILTTEVTIRPKASFTESLAGLVGTILGKQSYQAYINGHVLELNRWLREYAQSEGLLLLDIHGVLSDASGMRTKAYADKDGSHISTAGYEALSAYCLPILQRHFESQAPRDGTGD